VAGSTPSTAACASPFSSRRVFQHVHRGCGGDHAFFGGWKSPPLLGFPVPGVVWFFLKVYVLISGSLRWTFPRLRFDQLMNFSWKVMIPVALIHLVVYAGIIKIID
jgi:NADH:ubiquinone oxidoreductase subunit H